MLTYISYKNHFDICTEIDSNANSCQIEPAKKDVILLWDAAVILYKAGSSTGIKDRQIKFTLSTATYSIDSFNAKVQVAILKQRCKIGKHLKLKT